MIQKQAERDLPIESRQQQEAGADEVEGVEEEEAEVSHISWDCRWSRVRLTKMIMTDRYLATNNGHTVCD